jgi:hypothetical protein
MHSSSEEQRFTDTQALTGAFQKDEVGAEVVVTPKGAVVGELKYNNGLTFPITVESEVKSPAYLIPNGLTRDQFELTKSDQTTDFIMWYGDPSGTFRTTGGLPQCDTTAGFFDKIKRFYTQPYCNN